MPLSARQMEYLALAWQCFETEPKIDYTKFRTVAGLASIASARELMRVTKNKLKTEYGALGDSVRAGKATTPKATPGKGGVTPGKGAAMPNGAVGKKRGRGRGGPGRKEDEVEGELDDEEEVVGVAAESPCRKRVPKGLNGEQKKEKGKEGRKKGNKGVDEDCAEDGSSGTLDEGDTIAVVQSEPTDFGFAIGGGTGDAEDWFS